MRVAKNFYSFFIVLAMGLIISSPLSAAERPDSFADLSEKLLPSVVNISTTQKVVERPGQQRVNPLMPRLPEGSPFNEFFEEFFRHQMPPMGPDYGAPQKRGEAEPREYNRPFSLGSGFVIDADKGFIVTNNHVIDGADDIKVTLHDDTTLDATLIGSDEKTDVALLQVETDHPLVEVSWGDSDKMRVGEWVLAIGNPFGLGGTVTAGIISARQRDINAGPYDDFIQTDASINRGNSGGPMFNIDGEVIGINTAIFSPSGGSVGIGFAIPSAMAKSVVKQLMEYGRTRRGWLGVSIQTVTDDIAESLGLDKAEGALVARVSEDSPAAQAGFKSGDVILSFDGQDIEEMRELPRVVAETKIDKEVRVRVWREGKPIILKVTVGEMEEAMDEDGAEEASKDDAQDKATDPVRLEKLGIEVTNLDRQMKKAFNFDEDTKGVVITAVDRSSQAARKRVARGAILTEFNQREVTSAKALKLLYEDAIDEGKETVLLLLEQNGARRFVALKLSE